MTQEETLTACLSALVNLTDDLSDDLIKELGLKEFQINGKYNIIVLLK